MAGMALALAGREYLAWWQCRERAGADAFTLVLEANYEVPYGRATALEHKSLIFSNIYSLHYSILLHSALVWAKIQHPLASNCKLT